MRISSAFPSEYLRAPDLQGREVLVVIERCEMKDFGDDCKPTLYFRGKSKGLPLNKTNSATIAEVLGDETDGWVGEPIVLYPTKVDYQGKRVDAIRVKVPTRKQRSEAPIERTPPPAPQGRPVRPSATPPAARPGRSAAWSGPEPPSTGAWSARSAVPPSGRSTPPASC